MTHLVVCAIEDPGVPNPLKQLTILGQNLRQVGFTTCPTSKKDVSSVWDPDPHEKCGSGPRCGHICS